MIKFESQIGVLSMLEPSCRMSPTSVFTKLGDANVKMFLLSQNIVTQEDEEPSPNQPESEEVADPDLAPNQPESEEVADLDTAPEYEYVHDDESEQQTETDFEKEQEEESEERPESEAVPENSPGSFGIRDTLQNIRDQINNIVSWGRTNTQTDAIRESLQKICDQINIMLNSMQ